ncbi:MAG TPA: flagellar motor switch protein FliM [Candidatus Sulfotelmatobacter sp.]|nr:flagellar motor switch protein FliM [Candidatus Sulfotelmatobacter sp.]
MEKVLSQEEIDAMVRLARTGGQTETHLPSPPHVELWDVRLAGQIGREQLQAITSLHEGFARNLTHSLSAYLRVVFAATLVSAEHLSYRDFLQRIPETTYLASCRVDPMGVNAALQLDLKVAFPIIDLLLGGEGKGMAPTREITDIEEQILDSVARIVCRELGAAWQALALTVVFEQRLEAGAAQRLMPPEEKTLSLSFEVTMPEVRGGLNVAVPAVVSNALLRQISASWSRRPPRGASDSRRRLMRRLLECPFQAELGAIDVRAAVSELAGLAPGDLLAFARSAAEPASLLIAGQEMFRAVPARCGDTRAARVLAAVAASTSPADPKENTK